MLALVVRSNRRATVAQIAQEVNAGSDRKVSEYTVHHSLLCMGLYSSRPIRVPMLTPVHRQKCQQWTSQERCIVGQDAVRVSSGVGTGWMSEQHRLVTKLLWEQKLPSVPDSSLIPEQLRETSGGETCY
ncbi:hypothetical protein DPX16_2799 [Anabarilius grahami]|uniref:Transposase Tc1-like domain-containing protein n=1 Tax=Anabarilius grahami TaxID=495550 RepID=A0A3N0YWR9_ANAGA|nr:hypothetical protein DPX16_2799 [Anabarilius grahami]